MGNMIGILSTVILVSTLATLIFAVGAYVMARRRRSGGDIAPVDDDFDEQDPIRSEPEPPSAPLAHAPSAGKPAAPAPLSVTEPVPVAAQGVPSQPDPKVGKPIFRRLTPRGEEDVNGLELEPKSGSDWE